MKYLFFLLFSISIYAQNIVSGNTISEQGFILQNVSVVNIQTNEQVISDHQGFFKIKANTNDELRFIKEKYDRTIRKVNHQDFANLISVTLIQSPIEIEQVDLDFNATGDLKKDINLRGSNKKKLLNEEIKDYIKDHPEEKKYSRITTPNFGVPDMNQGQVSILSIGNSGSGGILGLVAKQIFKKDKHKPDFSEIQNFHRKVKDTFYDDYFTKQGLDEFGFESYLVYLDSRYKFSEKYFNNFNTLEIEKKLKNLLQEYINKR
ncbi:hypothetical protein ACM40_09210 [Chryseobacterium sp. BLS98]|uniref:hypothetical protein n=1 Tax=Chryseobacterium sp. BLS98 TaxID=885586 RepID=UPI00065ADFB8|nr:hypothetical protein [Chryseobacterium sp. BLS98]KMQ62455.1 hypothetical protein ACM40_09210 [Chryseobacterium sp. BLS98]